MPSLVDEATSNRTSSRRLTASQTPHVMVVVVPLLVATCGFFVVGFVEINWLCTLTKTLNELRARVFFARLRREFWKRVSDMPRSFMAGMKSSGRFWQHRRSVELDGYLFLLLNHLRAQNGRVLVDS